MTAIPIVVDPRPDLDVGTLKAGGETSVEMQIMPTEEGEVGSVATVRFQADALQRAFDLALKMIEVLVRRHACPKIARNPPAGDFVGELDAAARFKRFEDHLHLGELT